MIDSITATELSVIYPEREEWTAVDQFAKEEETGWVKYTPEWQDFVNFMRTYFTEGDTRRPKWGRDAVEDSRAILGGRYGCAQFLQICGPHSLQRCSLGRLNYMVQVAIREDLLRYQKTLLVWTSCSFQPKTSTNSRMLQKVQDGISDVLFSNKGGVSLA